MAGARRLGFIDVGARGGTPHHIQTFHDRLTRVLVEPEPEEFARLQEAHRGDPAIAVIGTALGDIDGTIAFHETVNATCSSALRVNNDLIGQYGVKVHFAPKSEATMQCSRFDTLYRNGGLPVPDVIKVDVQGFEFQVLQGFGSLLEHCLAIELEAHFYQLYEGQKTIGGLVSLLDGFGFVLRRLSNIRSPDLNGDPHFDGDLVEVDATFTKRKQWLAGRDEETRERFRLACAIMGVPHYG